jgi:hypothetical protein
MNLIKCGKMLEIYILKKIKAIGKMMAW